MIANLNGQKLTHLVTLVFPGILIATLKTQAISSPEFPQLSFAANIIGAAQSTINAGLYWSRSHCRHRGWRNGVSIHRWATPWLTVFRFFLLNTRQCRCSGLARRRVQAHSCADLIPEADDKPRDKIFLIQGRIQRDEMIHNSLKRETALSDSRSLLEVMQTMGFGAWWIEWVCGLLATSST